MKKPYQLNLDCKIPNVEKLNPKSTIYIGDTVKVNVKILDNDMPVDITNSTIRLVVASEESDKCVEQIEGITIVNGELGEFEIVLKQGCLIQGLNCGQFEITKDTTIFSRKFVYVVLPNTQKGIVESAKTESETLARLNQVLDMYVQNIRVIDEKIDGLVAKMDTTDIYVDEQVDLIYQDIFNLNKDIVNNTIKNKSWDFMIINNGKENVMAFVSPVISSIADNLKKYGLQIHTSGYVYNTSISMPTYFTLLFYNNMGNITPIIGNLMDVSRQNNNVSPRCKFYVDGVITDTIPHFKTNFRILIQTNYREVFNKSKDLSCYATDVSKLV